MIKKGISLLMLCFLFTVCLNSCCKFQIEAPLEIKFEDFNYELLDSVLLIKTERNDINQHIDTVYYNLSSTHLFTIPVYDNDSENASFKIVNLNPFFEYFVTEINADRTKSRGCAGNKIKFSFKLNGTQYEKKYNHKITIKP